MAPSGILSEFDAAGVLSPYAADLRFCVLEAFRHFTGKVAPVIAALSTPTTRAGIIHDLILERVRLRWPDQMLVSKRRCFLRVAPDVLLQFKKLNADRLPSNYPTRRAVQFAQQRPLNGLPSATRLTLGYSLSALGTEVSDVTVLCQTGWTYASWYYDILDDVAPIKQLTLLTPETSRPRKLRPKRTGEGESKSETNDQ
jgi:hypothetical protein